MVAVSPGKWLSTRAEQGIAKVFQVIERWTANAGQDVKRRAFRQHPTLLEQEESRAHGDRLRRAVRHVEYGDAFGALNGAKPLDQRLAVGQVECRDRLVAEQDSRSRCQRSSQSDPLPLPSRKSGRPPIQQVLHPAKGGDLGQAKLPICAALVPQTEPDVFGDTQMREQEIVLKDHADPPPTERLVNASSRVKQRGFPEADISLIRTGKSRDQPQDRGLARPGGPEQDTDFRAQPEGYVKGQARVDSPDQADIKDRTCRAQCTEPRTGRVRCTSQSAAIETTEIQRVNRPARAGSPAWTAS